MAAAELRDELTCCICTEIYKDPVTLICGHSFCKLCITRTWDNQEERESSCPECRHRFRVRPELKRALSLSNIVETFRSTDKESQEQKEEEVRILCTYCESPVPANKTCLMCEASLCEKHLRKHSASAEHVLTEPTTLLEKRKCSVHKKVLEYYCCEDATCICVYCSTEEHKGHQVETLNEASKKEKEKMRYILEKLTTKRDEAEERVQSLQELKGQLQGRAAKVTEQITALIRDIKEQLDALENRILKEIFRQEEQVSDLIRHLEIKKDELSKNIGRIEELCNLMDPVTFLEGQESHSAEYCDAVEGDNQAEKYGTKVHDVGDLDVGMILATLRSGLAGIVSKAKRSSLPETSDMLLDVNKTSDIFLDLITADNHVSVSGDLKTVSWSVINQRRRETPGRFQDYPQVLSSKSFSSGRHYWEVEGSKSGWWGVGMTYPSIARTGGQSMTGDNNKSWGLEKWDNKKYYVKHDKHIIRLYHPPSSRRLGIFLDYEAGRLSFYELRVPVRHLHTFTATFTEPLHAVFGIYRDNTWVRIGGLLGFCVSYNDF